MPSFFSCRCRVAGCVFSLLLFIGLNLGRAESCLPAPAGLIGWWPADGNSFDIAGTNAATRGPSVGYSPGRVGQAFAFSGASDSVSSSSPSLTFVQNSFTIEFWVLPQAERALTPEANSGGTGAGGQRYAVYPEHGGTSGPAGVGVSVGLNGISVFEHADYYLPSLLVYNAPILDWTHVAVVYQKKQPSLYVNGSLVRTGITSQRSFVFPSKTFGDSGAYGPFKGLLDEISIYDRPLTASEVQGIYAAGASGKCRNLLDIPYGDTLWINGSSRNGHLNYQTSGLRNSGTLRMESSDGGYASNFSVTNGILTNWTTGIININPGTGGPRVLSAIMQNWGTINVNYSASFGPTGGIYENMGEINIAGGQTLSIGRASVLNHRSGRIVISGRFDLSEMILNYDYGTIEGTPYMVNSTLNIGPNAQAPASFTLTGSGSTWTGDIHAGQSLWVQGSSRGNHTTMTVANGFRNDGTLTLQSIDGGYTSSLLVSNGAITNGGVININPGNGGPRVVNAAFVNRGSLNISYSANFPKADPAFSNEGTVRIDPGQTLTLGSAFVQTGGMLQLNSGTFSPSGAITIQGGSITGSGTINGSVALNGSLSPGLPVGQLSISGNLSETPAAALELDLAGAAPGTQFDRIAVSGSAQLNGALAVRLIDGFVPTNGQAFTIVSAASVTGRFARLQLPPLPDGSGWQVQYNSTTVTLKRVGGLDASSDTLRGTVLTDAGQAVPSLPVFATSRVDEFQGLRAEYFDNPDFTASKIVRLDPVVNFDWGYGSPGPAIGGDGFSARWTGFVEPLYSETYTFYTVTDDGVRLWVNGSLLIDDWHDHGPAERSGAIALEKGRKYDIKMEFYENGGGAYATLAWSSASQPKQIIPAAQLTPPPESTSSLTPTSTSDFWVASTTDSQGRYQLSVSPGSWSVQLKDLGSRGFYEIAPQPGLIASTNATATVDFVTRSVSGPSFQMDAELTIFEDAGAVRKEGFAKHWIPTDEKSLEFNYVVFAVFTDLFSEPPAIDSSGALSFTPAPDRFGEAEFLVYLRDSGGTDNGRIDASEIHVLRIQVLPVNDPPSFSMNPALQINEDAGPQQISRWASKLSAGPANESGQTLRFVIVADHPEYFSSPPSISPDGTLAFTPADNANGSTVIRVYAQDSGGTENQGRDRSAVQQFQLTILPVNDAPVAASGDLTTPEETPVNFDLTGSDIDQDPITFQVVRGPDHGTVTGTPPHLTYVPATNFNGVDSLQFRANDGRLDSYPATIRFVVTPVNDPPVLSTITDRVIPENGSTGSIPFSITDPDTDAEEIGVHVDTSNPQLVPKSGILIEGDYRVRRVTVTPALNQVGTARITLTADDGISTSQTAFNVTVRNWNSTTVPGNGILRALASGGGKVVGVGDAGLVVVSQDGRQWTAVSSTVGVNLRSVAWGSGRFVAVGDSGTILTSLNGSTWTVQQAPLPLDLHGVTYAQAQFVAVGDHGFIVTSPDSASWSVRPSGTVLPLWAVAFGNGQWLAVGDQSVAVSSSDAATWLPKSIAGSGALRSLVFANSLFVAVGRSGLIQTSPDGGTWTTRSSNVSTDLESISFGLGRFEAVGPGGTTLVSSDAVTWRLSPSGISADLHAVLGGSDRFYAAGSNVILDSVNTPPSVSYIEDQVIEEGFEGRSVTFSIFDPETPAALLQVVAFPVDSKIPPARLTLGGSGTNRTLSIRSLSGDRGFSSVRVEVSDGRDVTATAFDIDFRPISMSSGRTSDYFFVTWNSTPGRSYQVEYSADLRNWQPLGEKITATTTGAVQKDTSHPQGPRFYRVVALP